MWGKLGFNFFQVFLEDYFAIDLSQTPKNPSIENEKNEIKTPAYPIETIEKNMEIDQMATVNENINENKFISMQKMIIIMVMMKWF